MHPSRLAFLAGKHAQPRKVTAKCRTEMGGSWLLTLECGHESFVASHFDCSGVTERNCAYCGEIYVRNAPQYAKEF